VFIVLIFFCIFVMFCLVICGVCGGVYFVDFGFGWELLSRCVQIYQWFAFHNCIPYFGCFRLDEYLVLGW
jgi:hypothetical protein